MDTVTTKYGLLTGMTYCDFYPDGGIKDCISVKENKLDTPFGLLVPHYQDDGLRRKNLKPISFYKNGNLKSISLQNEVIIATAIGILPAEYLSFYEDGAIRRVFPLDGKLSGYWAEEDEYSLARDFEFDFSFGKFKQKIIGIHFYENGAVKSITFWPKDTVDIETPAGSATVRIGISLYSDGKLKSYEPGKPTVVRTPIGEIIAYNIKALGIHGDTNSLSFTQDGKVEALTTSANCVEVMDYNGVKHLYTPRLKPSDFDPTVMGLVPLSIQFYGNKVCFDNNEENEYNIEEYKFSVQPFIISNKSSCSDCSTCTACG